ncbi:hypothetical protein [Empedobacter falsenii]|mgnify:CR=1 FL=1|uniref:Uncharacterized protein n=1 Tax=Empedobacter falsenii TaxID=343874 RepID=A0A376GLA8_9FLAO|nr:hypothetical protein [Empedobacter falsenii]RRT91691.1 hypothetical protein EGI89_07895 [Empedobacter falsenii]RRT91920.1 hypothetical protein EGI88_07425 [Empedobacter falsenii]STD59703.1 Uncharacterised protein [Empedobacter falsenii]
MKEILIFFFIGFCFVGNSQVIDSDIQLKVLKNNIKGEEFVFGKWKANTETETHLTYLGDVKVNTGKIYKIMNSTLFWGLSKRATNKILIFNEDNQYLGNYYVTLITDLPIELNNGVLIFKNLSSECDKRIVSKINLKNGLPEKFFRECKNGEGDIYSLDMID